MVYPQGGYYTVLIPVVHVPVGTFQQAHWSRHARACRHLPTGPLAAARPVGTFRQDPLTSVDRRLPFQVYTDAFRL